MGRSLYELLSIANGLLLMAAGRALMTAPVLDKLRWVGSWMMVAVGVRHLYQGYRLHELGDDAPGIPLAGWVTALVVLVLACAFVRQWAIQVGWRGDE